MPRSKPPGRGRKSPPGRGARVKHHAYMATAPTGEMALAIAHMEPGGTAVLDEVKVTMVTGGEAGIDAVYRGLRAQGIEVNDFRQQAGDHRGDGDSVKERAIAGVLLSVRGN